MKNLKLLCLFINFSLIFSSCSNDDDSPSEVDDPGNDEELTFDLSSPDRNFGNAYVTYEGNQTDVDFYRLHILPPGATFDSSTGVIAGGSTGDYLTFDFKVADTESFLISGDYEVGYGAFPMTVEGILYEDVTIDLDGPTDIPTLFVPEESEGVILEINDTSFTVDVEVMGAQASVVGEVNDVEIIGSYSSDYEFIELD